MSADPRETSEERVVSRVTEEAERHPGETTEAGRDGETGEGMAKTPGESPTPEQHQMTEEELLEAKAQAMELKATAGEFFREKRWQEVG